MFSLEPPHPGEFMLVTDQLAASGDFLLHRLQAAHLRHSALARCIVIAVSEDISRWKAIAAKSNLHLSQSLKFIELSVTGDLDQPCESRLHEIYDCTRTALGDRTSDEQVLVILEEVATLQWIGISITEIERFSRALAFLCRGENCPLIVRHHLIDPTEPDEVFRHLLQLSDYHIEVRPLSSGKSGVVSGEIAVHIRRSKHDHKNMLPISRSTAMQYRLTESGATFFEKGTGGGLL